MNKKSNYRKRGLCLVEILVSLGIVALLLTATSVAIDAALCNYKDNNNMNDASVAARNALAQITTNIRASHNDPAVAAIDVNGDGTSCTMTNQDGNIISYLYDPTAHTLKVNFNNGADWPVLLENVYPIATGDHIFTKTAPAASGFPDGTAGRIEVRFRVDSGNASRSVSSAVVPANIFFAS